MVIYESGNLDKTALDLKVEVESFIASSKEAEGIVFDIRGNTGGHRDPIFWVLPQILFPKAPPRVVSVAKYKIPQGEAVCRTRDGFLQRRFAYPVSYSNWEEVEEKAIATVARGFQPEWSPDSSFSDWHYMVVSPSQTSILAGKKVGVLMDDSNFSASDIFLGALKGVPNVSLFGTPSSGGSAYSGSYELHHSGIRVKLARMASFRPNGLLYDGRGIDPDVHYSADGAIVGR